MPPLRHIHGRPPGTPSRCRPSATPSLRCVVRFGAQRNYRCPGQARRPSKFPSPSFSAWSTPSATPPDTAHFRSFGEMLNQSAQIMVGGKSSLDSLSDPRHDPRMFRSKTYLGYESALYAGTEAIATTGRHVERTLIECYGCDPARVRTVHIG